MKLEIKDEETLYNDIKYFENAPNFFLSDKQWVSIESLKKWLGYKGHYELIRILEKITGK